MSDSITPKKCTLLRTDGTHYEVSCKEGLHDFQRHVGGPIEPVTLIDDAGNPYKNIIMLVNEEGLLQNLSWNPVASRLSNKVIVGNVLIIPKEYLN